MNPFSFPSPVSRRRTQNTWGEKIFLWKKMWPFSISGRTRGREEKREKEKGGDVHSCSDHVRFFALLSTSLPLPFLPFSPPLPPDRMSSLARGSQSTASSTAGPIICAGHGRGVVGLEFSAPTEDGIFLSSACLGTIDAFACFWDIPAYLSPLFVGLRDCLVVSPSRAVLVGFGKRWSTALASSSPLAFLSLQMGNRCSAPAKRVTGLGRLLDTKAPFGVPA